MAACVRPVCSMSSAICGDALTVLAQFLAERLGRADVRPDVLDDEEQWIDASAPLMPAAVLVAFIARPQPSLLLTRRQGHLRSHAGQVAFPGGRVDAGDADVVAAALREAREEVALPPALVQVVGTAAPFRTGTGYCITPVIGVIPPDLPLVPEPGEVARVFEAGCDHLFNPATFMSRTVNWQGARRSYWEAQVDGERIWGVTAGLIRNIGRRLGLDQDPAALNRLATQ